ncbi:MAG: hypothetical protein EHM68_09415 [Lysobacterales bacterium]|nr:MAG: hypothetical protein EHM68_09415 [Xanthomonadales bacterium]
MNSYHPESDGAVARPLLVIATALPLLRLDQFTIAGIVLLAFYLHFWETQRVYESVVHVSISRASRSKRVGALAGASAMFIVWR